jgi:CubicO group peptidase (beta-lactamase class C family)
LVARGTEILDERYFGGQTAGAPHTSFSVGKSFLSAVVGAAVDRGIIALDDPITKHLPELAERDPRFGDITIRDLVTMSSGIRYVEQSMPWSDDARTYYATDLRRLALENTAVEQAPGGWHYNNYNPLLTALILERAAGRSVSELLEEWIWQPAGLAAAGSWSLDSDDGFEKSESGVNAVPRDYLRFGMLYRDAGMVDNRRVLSPAWVETSTSAAQATPLEGTRYGYFWWVHDRGESFSARGNHGQYIFVFPAQDIVIVRLGSTYGDVDWPDLAEQVARHYDAS